jgi:hypothetical protein
MIFQIPQYWQLAIDGLQIFLCLLILFFFVARRTKSRKMAAESVAADQFSNFNARFLAESFQQQTDQAFDNILTVISNERRNLDRLLQLLAEKQPDAGITAQIDDAVAQAAASTQDCLPDDQLKAEVKKLAASGKDTGQISRQMKIPVGEVELILNLTKKSA